MAMLVITRGYCQPPMFHRFSYGTGSTFQKSEGIPSGRGFHGCPETFGGCSCPPPAMSPEKKRNTSREGVKHWNGSLWSLTSTSINQPKRWFHGIIHRNIVGFKVWTLVQTQQGSVDCWFILGGTERHVPDRIPRDPALPTYFMSFVDVEVLWHGFSIQYKYIYTHISIYIYIYMLIILNYRIIMVKLPMNRPWLP